MLLSIERAPERGVQAEQGDGAGKEGANTPAVLLLQRVKRRKAFSSFSKIKRTRRAESIARQKARPAFATLSARCSESTPFERQPFLVLFGSFGFKLKRVE